MQTLLWRRHYSKEDYQRGSRQSSPNRQVAPSSLCGTLTNVYNIFTSKIGAKLPVQFTVYGVVWKYHCKWNSGPPFKGGETYAEGHQVGEISPSGP